MAAGNLIIAGIGPGSYEQMTVQCVKALENCDCIAGYDVYVDLVRNHFPGKEFFSTPMRQEEKRCRLAYEKALEGKTVVLVCSGDAGVYGMSGLVYEIASEYEKINPKDSVKVSVLGGITSALSGSALLGAPLVHDFAVISLSDLMTPWEKIEKRLESAAEADFCIVLYNPMSHKRQDYLFRACEILKKTIPDSRPCGWARNIGREGEECEILTLGELQNACLDMFTTVFIGNNSTKIIFVNGKKKLVTPRGYEIERKL